MFIAEESLRTRHSVRSAMFGQSALVGAGLGLIGGIVGCFAGFHARARLVKSLRQPDFNVALLEDLVAIGGSLFIVSRF